MNKKLFSVSGHQVEIYCYPNQPFVTLYVDDRCEGFARSELRALVRAHQLITLLAER